MNSHHAHLYFLGIVPKVPEVFLGGLEACVKDGCYHTKKEDGHAYLEGCLEKNGRMPFLLEFALLTELVALQVGR